MNLQTRLDIERRIREKLVDTLLAHDPAWHLSIDDGECIAVARSRDAALLKSNLAAVDEEQLIVNRKRETVLPGQKPYVRIGSVFLVYGNDGYDVIADYSTSLEDALKPVNAYAEEQERLYG